jgi:hypothetical protein
VSTFQILDLDVGDDNSYDFDLTTAIDQNADEIWFTAKRAFADPDSGKVFQKGLNVSGLSGVTVTDQPTGKFTVTVEPADTKDLEDESLLFDCQVHIAALDVVVPVAKGVLRLSKGITQALTG